MHRNLFLLCPTDCLESVINDTFEYENYFYTALGNSFDIKNETLEYIKELIKKNEIRRICFVLSSDNPVISDALGMQFFSDITGLKSLYFKISEQKRLSELMWSGATDHFSFLSYFLNSKIKELRIKLAIPPKQDVKISGLIYNRVEDAFKDICSDLIFLDKHCLN